MKLTTAEKLTVTNALHTSLDQRPPLHWKHHAPKISHNALRPPLCCCWSRCGKEYLMCSVSCWSFLCKSFCALKGALNHDAFRLHLNPCNPRKKQPAGYFGCNVAHSLQILFPAFFCYFGGNFPGGVHKGRLCAETPRGQFFNGSFCIQEGEEKKQRSPQREKTSLLMFVLMDHQPAELRRGGEGGGGSAGEQLGASFLLM